MDNNIPPKMTQPEIDDLIRRYHENNCTPDEEKMINDFLDSYQDEDRGWDDKLYGIQKETENRLFSKISEKINPPGKRQGVILRWWYSTAAALLVILSLFYIFSRISNEIPVKEKIEPLVTKNINRGQKTMLHLIDGTVVFINSDTKITYPKIFTGNKREIFLDGEAFFEVSPDPEKPFIVHTGILDIKVLGTSFNINTYDDKITVTLATGKVHIQNTNPTIKYSGLGWLKPNQQFVYDKIDRSIEVNEVDVDPYIAWTKKQLVFKNEPIFQVVKKLEKWYDVEFIFANNDIKNCIFTGIFENESLELVLKSLHHVADINYTMEGEKIKLSGSGCPSRNSNIQ